MIKLVLSDLDGTLNDQQNNENTRNQISLENILGVKKLHKNNIEFGIITGNNFDIAKLQTLQISNLINIYASQNGCFIKHNENLIFEQYFAEDTLLKLQKYLMEHDILFICEDASHEYYSNSYNFEQIKLLEKLNYNSNLIKVNIFKQKKINKIQVKCLDNLDLMKKNLKKIFNNLQIVQGDNTTIDIMPYNTSKGNAILLISKLLKLELNEIAYFGDNENDLSAFKILKHSFIMNSAPLKLHKYANNIVNNVAQGIEQIIIYNEKTLVNN